MEWYRKAADQGDADAQWILGFMYEKGKGVAKDESTAVEWYRKAADQGYARAQRNLETMYAQGRAEQPQSDASEQVPQLQVQQPRDGAAATTTSPVAQHADDASLEAALEKSRVSSDGGGLRNQLVHEQKTTQRESHLNIIQKCIGEVLPALNQTDKTLIEQVILLENEIFGTNYDPDASFCQRVDRIANNIGVSVLKS